VRAIVLAGGGANIGSIARRSDLAVLETSVTWRGGALPDAIADRLDALYLQHARLDPFHAAAALGPLPILLIDARFDHVVPYDTGTLLWNRFDRPERWTVFGGHSILFWRLPHIADDIADWIDRAVAPD
jgi:hypothetical protein